jgi:hypothetical protein
VSSAGEPHRPDDGPRADQPYPTPDPAGRPYGPTPYDDPAPGRGVPPHVYNPYGNVSYPATYPVPPAGQGPDDAAPPVRRPGTVNLALVLLVLAALPYLLIGLLAMAASGDVEAAVPPDQLAQLQQLGVDLEQVVRATGAVLLAVALVFLLLAVLAWTGRGWARALLAAMAGGFVLTVLASVAAASSQGAVLDVAGLLVLALPVVLAAVGVGLMFGSAARAWFARPRGRTRA